MVFFKGFIFIPNRLISWIIITLIYTLSGICIVEITITHSFTIKLTSDIVKIATGECSHI